jgi:hypothetical protein
VIGLTSVVSGAVLRGVTIPCEAPLTILVDADVDEGSARAGGQVLRLLAGIGRPTAGKVRVLDRDPASDPALRREIALLGDDVLLDRGRPLDEAAVDVARVRGIDRLATKDAVRALVQDATPELARRRVADVLAAPERARLLLVSYPERHADPTARDALVERIRAAMLREVPVVLATTRLDDWLVLAHDARAFAFILGGGVVLAAGPAHGVPWSLPLDRGATRLVRVLLEDEPTATERAAPAARLASELLADVNVSAQLAAVEPIGRVELRLHTRAPRELARAIARRAHDGLAVRQLVVQGAPTAAIAAAYAPSRAGR